jgi:hypothetical protein
MEQQRLPIASLRNLIHDEVSLAKWLEKTK